jgi:MSHA biogenesis protein MshI
MERRVFRYLKTSVQARTRVGVSVSDGEAVLAAVRRPAGARPVLERVWRVPRAQAAASLRETGYGRAAVSAVLAEDDYQLAMIEAPDVLPAEMRAAVRWKLRDAIDFHVDDAVVDVFDLPAQGRRAQGRMMYAVAAKRAAVERQVAALDGLKGVDVVDVPEMCLRNLAQQLPAAEHGVAMLNLGERTATVVLVRGGTLYLARRLDLQTAVRFGGGDEAEVDASAVALQLQRSLDYYESHYDQPPIAEVAVLPAGARAAALADGLASETGLRVAVYDLADRLDCAEPPPADLQHACALAVGAALREERRTP